MTKTLIERFTFLLRQFGRRRQQLYRGRKSNSDICIFLRPSVCYSSFVTPFAGGFKRLACKCWQYSTRSSTGSYPTFLGDTSMPNGRRSWDLSILRKQLWKIARYFKTTHVSIPPLIDNGAQISPAEEKAEVLATRFERVHDLTIPKTAMSQALEVESTLHAFLRRDREGGARCQPVRVKEVQRDITSLKRRSAPGEDGVTTVMIRHLPTASIKHLTHLFSSTLSLGHFPQPWKQAKVLPIPKPKKTPSHPASYRPISLLSSISKMLERVVARRLAAHAKRFNLIPTEQFGFRKKHSTAQLARISDYIPHGYNLRKHTGMVLLDLEKAYDTIWTRGLTSTFQLISLCFSTHTSAVAHST